MKRGTKRRSSIAVLLSCVILMMSFSTRALAADAAGACGDGLSWSFSGHTLTISGKGAMTNYTDANLPPWYEYRDEIYSISLDDGITGIGDAAFFDCDSVTHVVCPDSVVRIGNYAFSDCEKLQYISLPSGLTEIGKSAFSSCGALASANLPDGLLSIHDKAFYYCASLKSITVPSSVTFLGSGVFAYCLNLETVICNAEVSSLSVWCFYGCERLNDLFLNDSITSMGENALEGCTALDAVTTGLYEEQSRKNLQDSIQSNGLSEGRTIGVEVGTADSMANQVTLSSNSENSDGNNQSTITATIQNDNDWNQLSQIVNAASSSADSNVKIDVQLSEDVVDGDHLKSLSSENKNITMTTPSGAKWQVYGGVNEGFSQKKYDLGISTTLVDSPSDEIKSDLVYQVGFHSDIDFKSAFSVQVGNENTGAVASLFIKDGNSYHQLQSSIVDSDGYAWFYITGAEKKAKYYVGINCEGVDSEDAIIPENLYSDYGMAGETLVGEDGTVYAVGERTSRWGITGKQFATYAGIGLGGLVLIVSLLMVTLNKMRRSKMKYEMMAEEDAGSEGYSPKPSGKKGKGAAEKTEELIDEDELRLEVMRELLEEKQKSGK